VSAARARRFADDCIASHERSKGVWLDPKLTTCEELTADGPESLVMLNFNAG
jgi:hypothetical protein